MKKIYFLSLVFTIGFCLALGSCRSGNRKKQNPVATQTDRSNIRYAQGFWLEQHEITDSFISKILKAKPVRNIPSP